MKIFLLILTLATCQISLAQNTLEVGYDLNLNIGEPVILPAKLVYTGTVSYFHWNDTGDGTEAKIDEETMEIKLKTGDSLGTINVVNYNNDSIYTRSLLFKEVLVLAEKKTELTWKLTEETKEFGSFICKKATTQFRGRDYTAWYTPEIPLNIGPWKLNGLPGLIVEAYDQERIVHFHFRSLKKVPADIMDYDAILASGKKISLKEFEKIQDNLADDLVSKIRSKLPRGATLAVDHVEENFLERDF